jgi:hypothetical protein
LHEAQLEEAIEVAKRVAPMPRLRRFKVSMFATPLSISIAAGVSASTSEIRPPSSTQDRPAAFPAQRSSPP